MKWREPWGVSLRHQPRFNVFGKPVLKTFLSFILVLTALGIVVSFGKDTAGQLENLMVMPSVILLIAGVLALFIRLTTWLSPKTIEFGPGGLVVRKAEDVMLIPWGAVAERAFVTIGGELALQLVDGSGASVRLFFASNVSRADIEREIEQHMRGAGHMHWRRK